jgi:hypothetical protein
MRHGWIWTEICLQCELDFGGYTDIDLAESTVDQKSTSDCYLTVKFSMIS